MRARLTLAVMLGAFAVMWLLATCGGGEERTVVQGLRAPQASFSPGSSVADKTSPAQNAGLDYPESTSLDEALVGLEEMPCPEGVDAELWVELKGALKEALRCRVRSRAAPMEDNVEMIEGGAQDPTLQGKFVSAPPEERVTDLGLTDHYDGTYTLSWSYENLGDYDQNGTVGISDITPLAIHYGEEVPEGDVERQSIQAVIDGSFNWVVDITDITPIAMNYGTCCAEYSIRSALTYPEDVENTTEIDVAPIELAEGEDRKTFGVEISEEPRTYIVIAASDGEGALGELSNVLSIPNHPPVAQLTAEPTEGEVPLLVSFDASGSSDIDGPIVSYEWDWEGDGVYDHDSGSVPTAEHTYDIAEVYDPQVRITDPHNGVDTASLELWAGDWHVFVAVDDAGGIGADLEVVSGYPAISYHEADVLMYVRATDALGTSWNEPQIISGIAYASLYNSLAIVNGRPAIAFYDHEDKALMYVRANDANGDSWAEPLTVADADIGDHPHLEDILSLAVINGRPAIAYQGDNPDGLAYTRALDADGDTWESPVQVAYLFLANYNSMAVINGRPAISYHDAFDDHLLKYVRANDAEGSAWGTPTAVGSSAGGRSYLAVINGHPAISYTSYEGDTIYLNYVRALDANGSAWGTPLILESFLDSGGWPCLATVNGRPAISYVVILENTTVLKYVRAADADGASWRDPVTVQLPESDEGGASWMSMTEVNGRPAISYGFNDPTTGTVQLRYAVYY